MVDDVERKASEEQGESIYIFFSVIIQVRLARLTSTDTSAVADMVSECNSQEFINFHLLTFGYVVAGMVNWWVDYTRDGGGWSTVGKKCSQ